MSMVEQDKQLIIDPITSPQQFRDVLLAHADKVFAAMPANLTQERFIAICVRCFRQTPKLANCDPLSIIDAVSQAATLGLEPDGVLGHAYLIPYGKECVLVPGYKGLVDLARRSRNVSTITMETVHKGDIFQHCLGTDAGIKHLPSEDADRHKNPVTHIYVVAKLRDGGVQFKVWTQAKIDAHKAKYSKAWQWAESGDRARGGGKKDSTWHEHREIMGKKTVLKDMINRGEIPVSAEVQRLSMQSELAEQGHYEDRPSRSVVSDLDDLTNRLEAPSGNDSQDDKPLTDPLDGLDAALAEATSLTETGNVRKHYAARTKTAAENDILIAAVEARDAEIRGKRGAGSNPNITEEEVAEAERKEEEHEKKQ